MRRGLVLLLSSVLLLAGGIAFAAIGIRALDLEREDSRRKALERVRHILSRAAQDAQRLALLPSGPPQKAWRLEIPTAEGSGEMPTVDERIKIDVGKSAERAGGADLETAYKTYSRLARAAGQRWFRQVAALRAGEVGMRIGQAEQARRYLEQASDAIPLLTWDGVQVRVGALKLLAIEGLRRGSSAETRVFLDEAQDGRRLVRGNVRGPDTLLLELAGEVERGLVPQPEPKTATRLAAAAAHVRLGRSAVGALPRSGATLLDDAIALRRVDIVQLRDVSSLVERLPGEFEAQVQAAMRPLDEPLGRYMTRLAPPLDRVVLGVRFEPSDSAGRGPLLALIGGLTVYALGALLAVVAVQRRRRAARMQSEFVAAVSHELKTPIASVRAMAEFMADEAGTNPERAREYAGRIEGEMRRLGTTVRNVLDASQVERQGVLPIALELGDPAVVVDDTAEAFRPDLQRRGFEFTCETVPARAPISFDPDALRGVLVNLLDNAAKFSPETREIRIEAGPVDGDESAYGIAVFDRGIGIDPRKQDRLFGRFYRGAEARRGAAPGVGLGLHVARSVIEAHDGRIWAEARPDGGSVFRIELREPDREE